MSDKIGQKKHRELFEAALNTDFNNSYALVELHRWQFGHLPGAPGTDITKEELDISIALRAMARAFGERDQREWPAPMNIASVLEYLAVLCAKHNLQPDWLRAGLTPPSQQSRDREGASNQHRPGCPALDGKPVCTCGYGRHA